MLEQQGISEEPSCHIYSASLVEGIADLSKFRDETKDYESHHFFHVVTTQVEFL